MVIGSNLEEKVLIYEMVQCIAPDVPRLVDTSRSTLFHPFWPTRPTYFTLLVIKAFLGHKWIFIQLQEFPTPPYWRCCSVTKLSDSGITEALKALRIYFWDPSQWDKMCFEYHWVIFHWKKLGQNFHICLRSRWLTRRAFAEKAFAQKFGLRQKFHGLTYTILSRF